MIIREELALLTAIANEPHNRVPALVWCDWIEEHPDQGHDLQEIAWLRGWLNAGRGERVAMLRQWPIIEAIHRANCHPSPRQEFYQFKSKLLRFAAVTGPVRIQEIVRSCWGCANCEIGTSDYYPSRGGCSGDGVYSVSRHYLQSYTLTELASDGTEARQWEFFIPLPYPPTWSDLEATSPADIIGRVPTDPNVTQDMSLRSTLTLAVASPWMRWVNHWQGKIDKSSLISRIVIAEQSLYDSIHAFGGAS